MERLDSFRSTGSPFLAMSLDDLVLGQKVQDPAVRVDEGLSRCDVEWPWDSKSEEETSGLREAFSQLQLGRGSIWKARDPAHRESSEGGYTESKEASRSIEAVETEADRLYDVFVTDPEESQRPMRAIQRTPLAERPTVCNLEYGREPASRLDKPVGRRAAAGRLEHDWAAAAAAADRDHENHSHDDRTCPYKAFLDKARRIIAFMETEIELRDRQLHAHEPDNDE